MNVALSLEPEKKLNTLHRLTFASFNAVAF